MTLGTGVVHAQDAQDVQTEDGSADPYAGERLCFRPVPPDSRDFPDRDEFYAEKEKYYRQSSIYISCIDQWIQDARKTYLEMYQVEAQSYLDERQQIMDELRAFGIDNRRY